MYTQKFAAVLGIVLAGCTTPDLYSVVQIDACNATPIVEPVDLKAQAHAAGCATSAMGGGFVGVTVESVVSPREFVVRDKYGLERVRPALSAATLARWRALGANDVTVRACLERALVGRQLLEPNWTFAPVVSDDGLRIGYFLSPDLEPLDDLVRSELARLPLPQAPAVLADGLDLSPVPRNDAELRERLAAAVELAESLTPFRSPWGLSAEWMTPGDLPPLQSSIYDDWWHTVDRCFDTDEAPGDDPDWTTISLPGGRIFVRMDHDWREFELQAELLRALMKQYQFALCAAGRVTFPGDVGMMLMDAHASSMTQDILRRSGASTDAMQLAREWDRWLPATQAFDRWRASLGLTPDEAVFHLVADRQQAKQVHRDIFLGMDERVTDGPLAFEFVGESDGLAVVTVINESDVPFSGYANGWWHLVNRTSRGSGRSVGGTPFALRLPPHGRITLVTQVKLKPDDDVVGCFVPYAVAPAPVL